MVLSNLVIVVVLAAITYLVLFRRHNRLRTAERPAGRGTVSAMAADESSVATSPSEGAAASPMPARRMCTHAVSIERDLLPCKAVQDLGDQRFLSHEAPDLPLAGCDRDKCTCRYLHHSDRRSNEERRLPFVTHKGFGFEVDGERRKKNDRRRG